MHKYLRTGLYFRTRWNCSYSSRFSYQDTNFVRLLRCGFFNFPKAVNIIMPMHSKNKKKLDFFGADVGTLWKQLKPREFVYRSFKTKGKNYSTQYSHVVTHHSTNWAITSLTSEIRRDLVGSSMYGRSWDKKIAFSPYSWHKLHSSWLHHSLIMLNSLLLEINWKNQSLHGDLHVCLLIIRSCDCVTGIPNSLIYDASITDYF